ncbi:hypothetical protein [Bartonella sp. CL162QHHD]|uniref:hypothetical protein n=1 Tax=Bartonella sp. CL162QHHD TaxID=3243516 RepID=UPI0035D0BF2B
MREAFRFSHSTFATITYPYKSIFFRNTKRTKRNRLALHIHTLILKKDLSTLVTPILQNAARKGMVKAPMKCIKSIQPPYLYAYGETSLRLWKNEAGIITKTLPAPNVADSLRFKRLFIKGMPFLYSFAPHAPRL